MQESRLILASCALFMTGLLFTTGFLGWVSAAIWTLSIAASILLFT